MTDRADVAEALAVRPETLAAAVDDDTTAAEVLGRFAGDAPVPYSEARGLVEEWLAGDRTDARNGGALGGQPGEPGTVASDDGGDADSGGGPDEPDGGTAEPEPVTESNRNAPADDREDTSTGTDNETETPDGDRTADAAAPASAGTSDDSAGYRPACDTDGLPSHRELLEAAPATAGREHWGGSIE